jgi:hypothetical protein
MARGSARSVTEGAAYLHPTGLLNEGDLPVEARRVEWPRALSLPSRAALARFSAVPVQACSFRHWSTLSCPTRCVGGWSWVLHATGIRASHGDLGVIESVGMMRGLVADTDAQPVPVFALQRH